MVIANLSFYDEIKAFIFAFKIVLDDACHGHHITALFYRCGHYGENMLSSTPN